MNERKERVYFENLDALRLLAALAVMGEHITRNFYFPDDSIKKYFIIAISLDGSGGEWGVSFFFVLSGFLITHLLLEEAKQEGSIQLSIFYARRILRIWPLYFVVLILGFIFHPFLDASLTEKANPLLYSTFLANFDNIYGVWPQSGILGVQWSVAIEEQFYLLWPLVIIILVRHQKIFLPLVSSLVFLSILFRVNGGHRYHTLSGLAPLMIGAALAFVAVYKKDRLDRLVVFFSRNHMRWLYVGFFLLILFNYRLSEYFHWGDCIAIIGFPLMAVVILIEQAFSSNACFRLGRLKLLSMGGKMSYGIYLLHMVAILLSEYVFNHYTISFWLAIGLIALLTTALVTLSYYLFEKPILNWRPQRKA
ncbi:MAG: acyltransferase family protein [Cyclobacteriaceae bacterium]|jgi:peptidoglycan/LPS O-acetylase OafA/YrhL|nr:acyltransferase [Flammeovirgaceae bacterium]